MGAFQDWLKEQFKQARGGSWTLDPNLMPHRTIDLFHVRARDESGDTYAIGPIAALKVAADRIVEHERHRFGICLNPRCQRPFVAAIKKRGKYCSPRCASYVNVMKSRGKPVV